MVKANSYIMFHICETLIQYLERGNVLNKKTLGWMRAYPKYWRILCGLEQANARTNIKFLGMLVKANLTELDEMMGKRISEMC
jgi:hypothetical protein